VSESDGVLVRAGGLRKDYGSGEGLMRAVDEVDLVPAAVGARQSVVETLQSESA